MSLFETLRSSINKTLLHGYQHQPHRSSTQQHPPPDRHYQHGLCARQRLLQPARDIFGGGGGGGG
jgi:hypothetical protein